jgi:F-type H+-transporting ATPase subunit gamma
MQDIEGIKAHLENLHSVEPIITSLRTIAAGSWRMALQHAQAADEYVSTLSEVLAVLLPRIPYRALPQGYVARGAVGVENVGMVVVASERGLCGNFNDVVLEGAERLIAQQQLQSKNLQVMTLGARARRYFERREVPLLLAESLPVTRVPSFAMARSLAQKFIRLRQEHNLQALFVIHSPYKAGQTLPPVSRRWLPVDASILPEAPRGESDVIIETDPRRLFARGLQEWIYAQFYHLLMESTASEQAARFRAMDTASNNLTRNIEELTRQYHTARQAAITMQMLDLVAGAGLLRGPHGTDRS